MKFELKNICDLINEKISANELINNNLASTYVSTESMLPNKRGITKPSSIPSKGTTTAYKKDDVLVSNIRPYFKKIWSANYDGVCSNDVLVFRAKNTADANFLYYVLANDDFFVYSMATSKGTKMPRGDKASIMKYEVESFDLNTQRKIASILKPIDKKIELNNAINNNLEQQAQAIFKSWFIDFEPFNKTRPSDWTIGTIDDLAKEVVCGKTPSTKKAEYYGSNIPFITIPDMHGKTYAVTTERYLSKLGANSQVKKSLPKNSICVSCIGTAGLVTLVAEESQTNQQINSIIPKDGFSPYYIYLLMQTLSDTINKLGQSGSTIVNLNKSQFGKIQVIIPALSVMIKFDKIVFPMFEKMLQNQMENLKLTSLRDALLPRLMSGELDVSDIEI